MRFDHPRLVDVVKNVDRTIGTHSNTLGHAHRPFGDEHTVGIELLNTTIDPICHIDLTLTTHRDAIRVRELAVS